MSNIERLKALLASVDASTPIRVNVGANPQQNASFVQLTATELMHALGIRPTPKVRRVVVTEAASPTLRLRSKPDTDAAVIGRFFPGEVLDVYDQPPTEADNLRWLQLADNRGWVAEQFTAPAENGTQPVWRLPFTAQQRGVHASAGGWSPAENDGQLDLVRRNRVEVALIVAYEPGQATDAIRRFKGAGVRHFIIRAATHAVPTANPGAFVQQTRPLLSEYAAALGGTRNMMIALHNEPNLVPEGWGAAWHNGAEFAAWFKSVAAAYRTLFAGAKIGFPALSPGKAVPNLRSDEEQFIRESASAINDADWIGVHYYWQRPDGTDINPPAERWRTWFASKPIVGTEIGPSDQNIVTAQAMRLAYQRFAAANVPAVAFLLNGAGRWQNAAWDVHHIVC
jgi:hypothetical protein